MHPRPRETKLAAKKNGILNEAFRSGSCVRFDLARRLNINATMVGAYVEELLGEGLLTADASGGVRKGRTALRTNPDYGCFLGLDFEALRARAVLCDFAGEVIEQRETPFKSGMSRENVLRQIVSLAQRLADKAPSPLLSVGIAAPGVVDCRSGRVLHYRLLPDFDQAPVQERFEAAFDAPVFVEHNIRAVAYGELLRGSGRGNRNFVCLAVRSGIGMGIVIDGKLYSGANSMAGEAGYLVLPTRDGPQLASDLMSAKGFVAGAVQALKGRQLTPGRRQLLDKEDDLSLADLVAAADAGDELLQQQLEELGARLGMLAANLANLFAPEKIVLAGEVPNCSPLVRRQMERTFRQFTLTQTLTTTYLEDAALGGFAGALGVAWLGFANTFPEDEETLVELARENREKMHQAV